MRPMVRAHGAASLALLAACARVYVRRAYCLTQCSAILASVHHAHTALRGWVVPIDFDRGVVAQRGVSIVRVALARPDCAAPRCHRVSPVAPVAYWLSIDRCHLSDPPPILASDGRGSVGALALDSPAVVPLSAHHGAITIGVYSYPGRFNNRGRDVVHG